MKSIMPQYVNSLDAHALTIDHVRYHDHITVRHTVPVSKVERFVLTSEVFTDECDGGTLVIDAMDIATGTTSTYPTSYLGLTGNRYTGEYTATAYIDEWSTRMASNNACTPPAHKMSPC